MTIEVTNLNELDATRVQDRAELLGDQLAERYPDLDPARGANRRLILHPGAVLAEKSWTELDRLRRSLSLSTAVADPALADQDLLDAAASNFRIDRYPGSAAIGSIVIVVSRQDPLLIPRGFTVEARGFQYTTDRPFSIRSNSSGVTSSDDRVLTPTADDNFSFSIPVTATEIGAAGRLLRNEAVEPSQDPANFVKSYAASDFTGGVDQESNAALLNRVRTGVACRALSDRVSMSASLLAEYPEVVTQSIIGAGDGEMLRDQHSIFPGSHGGCVDWWIRTGQLPTRTLLTKTATLVDVETDGNTIWQFGLGRDEAPGFYDIYSINQTGVDQAGYEVTSDIRDRDVTALDSGARVPDIISAEEAAYSRFSTASIRFRDTDTPSTGLTVGSSTRSYDVVVRHFADLAEIQDVFGARDREGVAGDLLIRAPVPAYLQISLDILQPPDTLDIDEASIQNDVLTGVNTLPIGSELPSSTILDIVHRYLPAGAFVNNIDMLCRIRTPAGESIWYRSSTLLEIPNRAAEQVTSRTTVFVLEPEQLSISIRPLNRLNV